MSLPWESAGDPSGRLDLQSGISGGHCLAIVVRHERGDFGAEPLRGREVDGVECPERRSAGSGGDLGKLDVEFDEGKASQYGPRIGGWVGARDRLRYFDHRNAARHQVAATDMCLQFVGFWLSDHELRDR